MGQYYESFTPHTALHEIGRDAPRIRSGYADQDLKEAVEERLLALAPVLDPAQVTVRVEKGIAILEGKVQSARLREVCGNFADRVQGVRGVDNRLGVLDERSGATVQ